MEAGVLVRKPHSVTPIAGPLLRSDKASCNNDGRISGAISHGVSSEQTAVRRLTVCISVAMSAALLALGTLCGEQGGITEIERQLGSAIVLTDRELSELAMARTREQTRLYMESKAAESAWLTEALAVPESAYMDAGPVLQVRELVWEHCSDSDQGSLRLLALIRGGMPGEWMQSDDPITLRHNHAVILVLRRESRTSWMYKGSVQVGGRTQAWGGPSLPVDVVCGPEGRPWLKVKYGGIAGTGMALDWYEYFDISRSGPLVSDPVFSYTESLGDANMSEWLYGGAYGDPVFSNIDGEPVVMLTLWRRVKYDKESMRWHQSGIEPPDWVSRTPPLVTSVEAPCVEKIGLAVFRADDIGIYRLDERLSQWTADELESWSRDLVDPWPCSCERSG